MDMKKLKHAFNTQKYHAEHYRNIGFDLTFEQWLDIWTESGHLEERGRRKGQYCMSRYGDTGAYEKGNVFIQPHSNNASDAKKGKKGHQHTEETKAKMSKAKKGISRSEETKAKMKVAQIKRRASEE